MIDDDEEINTGEWESVRYSIDPTLDPSVRRLVEKMLPLATYYMSISAFVEQHSRYEYGSINHALSAALSSILKDYETFVTQLEYQFQSNNNFTLQQFWFYTQEDTAQQMGILHDLVTTIRQLRYKRKNDDDDDDIEAVLEGLKNADEGGQVKITDQEKGGPILNILTDRMIGLSGDPRCKKIYAYLLARASVPYFEILHSWIYRGKIHDPHNEFMVLEKLSVRKENLKEDFNDAYWEMRYTVREKLVPTFLEPLQSKILLAGKYLNVVRECGVNIAKPEDMQAAMDADMGGETNETSWTRNTTGPARGDVWSAVNGAGFVKSLEIAYRYANHTLLNLLVKEQQLIARLRSLKHYFFLDQSDFLTSFLDLAKDELKQPAREISLARLQSLMDLVLRNSSSVAAYDPFKEDLKVTMSPLKLVDELLRIINVAGLDSLPRDARWMNGVSDASRGSAQMERSQSMVGSISGGVSITGTSTAAGAAQAAAAGSSRDVLSGYDALTLDYTVTFPLSLVISRKALTKYQLLFRHLLYLKHVEDMLCDAWMAQKDILWKTKSSPQVDAWKYRIFTLRHRMLMFVQQFAYYVTNEVLEPNWRRLESNLAKVSTVDQVLQYHSDFLDTCLKECMLTNAKLLRIYNKLMTSCVVFVAHTERFSQLLSAIVEQQSLNQFGIPKGGLSEAASSATATFEKAQQTLGKIEETFKYHMKLLIEALNYYSATETVQFLCLVVRLDYNQYHKSKSK
ncbi:gamma-tubulin complex component protein [Zychaea mexicana]|uniref:gamma-tubulin complex component protein n=1 Tax=Zychaea mexicana TaxID=64656 RepID=UPI0022FE6137|nr:gamma-tubulin complex component protein [Zychaea mexicana]KAI9492777.1 gamma-tubulin complex component protein [Zychaea mexicana]